jgi:hypothetical protein
MKIIIGFLLAGILLVLLFMAYMQFSGSNNIAVVATPQATILPTPQATQKALVNNPSGNVNVKLCYPSEMIPAGTIEIKNIVSKEVTTNQYLGSDKQPSNIVKVTLPQGQYIMRFKVGENMYGYSTDVCPTGIEATCAQAKPRINKTVTITANQDSEQVNLCDFYYSPQTQPSF